MRNISDRRTSAAGRPGLTLGLALAPLLLGGGILISSCQQVGSVGPPLTHNEPTAVKDPAATAHDGATLTLDAGAPGTGGSAPPATTGVDAGATGADARDPQPDTRAAPAETRDAQPDTRDAGVDTGSATADARIGTDASQPGIDANDAGGGYTLVFGDEFTGTSLDRTKWCTRYIYGGGAPLQVPDTGCTGPDGYSGTLDFLNDEQQRYVDFNTAGEAMHVESGGTLKLRATKTRADTYASYDSSMIRSKLQFKPTATTSYYVVARLRLPNVKGTWPALWLVPGLDSAGKTQWPPEIDIFEGALNTVEDKVNMIRMGSQVRGGKQTDTGAQQFTDSAPSFDRTWGNYIATDTLRGVWLNIGATWTANSICYYVNEFKTMCENYHWVDDSGTPANPASLLLNLAVGGAWAGRHGIDDTGFPTTLEADYVHVYTFAGGTAPGTLPQ